ncbi:MAG TPA: DoxX family protein [Patescibacteria group bacterium]
MEILTATNEKLESLGILLLRLALGVILFIGGAGKVMGWFGALGIGFGIEKTLGFYAASGFSAPLAYLSMFAEFVGGFLLVIGLLTRLAALAVTINMLVAFVVMLPQGFFLGFAAYPFVLAIVALTILLTGPGRYSLDALIFRK